ncbi:MAG TPA: hypothetical protein VK449_01010 [Anaerolineales bacterium]|nr:hypothetical protein [Anaerolineales bacterium]
MLDKVHDHILAELGHSARIDTIVVVVAIVFDLIALGINASAAAAAAVDNGSGLILANLILVVFLAMTGAFNLIALGGMLLGRSTRSKLLAGMPAMYHDNNVDQYYDKSLLTNYGLRYLVFGGVILVLAGVAMLVPVFIRFA